MNAKYKRYIRTLLIGFLSVMFISAAVVIVIDPFFHYHKPLKGIHYIIDNQLTQNPGIAKNFDYDSVILGSSMTINFDTDLFGEVMGLNTVKLSYNGAYPKDIDNIMRLVIQSPNEVSHIFLGIDIFTYKAPYGFTAYEIPDYLYDDSYLNDISYLLNKDVLLNYFLAPQIQREDTPLNEAYWNWPYMTYSAEWVMSNYEQPTVFAEPLPADSYQNNIKENLRICILPYIEAMPDTEFVIFFPPYSILYWYTRYADGSLAAELAGEKQIMEELFAYPNVKVYYFQNQYDFIINLDNYTDYTHYTHEMNNQMTLCFAEEDCPYELTAENYETVLDEMNAWLAECDFESYLTVP